MYLFKDTRGRTWLTAEGVYRFFGIRMRDRKKYFYSYEWLVKVIYS